MTPAEIVAECERRGVLLTLGPNLALQYDAPAGALTHELRAALTEHKAGVVQTLFEREERAGLQDAPGKG